MQNKILFCIFQIKITFSKQYAAHHQRHHHNLNMLLHYRVKHLERFCLTVAEGNLVSAPPCVIIMAIKGLFTAQELN